MGSAAPEPTDSDEQYKTPWLDYSGVAIRQRWVIRTHTDPYDDQWGRRYAGSTEKSCLLGVKDQDLRIRFPTNYSGPRWLEEATTELKHLVVCAIAGLVPLGIMADKLEEEYPDLKEAADHLREWERLARESANSSYL